MEYNLEERTANFAEKVIELCKKAQKNDIVAPILNQLIRAATSIGANYMEANGASSRKEESRETKYWLRLLSQADRSVIDECRKAWQEAQELTLIFGKINKNSL